MFRAIGLLAIAAFAFPAGASADVFRYLDADGVEHYTNIQPKGRGWQRIYRSTAPKKPAAGRRSGRARSPDPKRATRYDAHLREAAALYQLPEPLLRAVMRVESGFHSKAVSVDGAMGLMQLMPATAASMGVVDPFEPRQNVLGGARFLRVLANRFGGSLILTVAAYNAGGGAVRRYGGVPPYAETRRYVQRVLSHYYRYLSGGGASRLARR